MRTQCFFSDTGKILFSLTPSFPLVLSRSVTKILNPGYDGKMYTLYRLDSFSTFIWDSKGSQGLDYGVVRKVVIIVLRHSQ